MKLIDLTHPLSEKTSVHPAKTCFTKIIKARYEHLYKIEDIHLCTGIGTHMDSPSHFKKDGYSIDEIPLEDCIGEACVLHLKDVVKDDIDYGVSKEDILNWEKKHGKIETGFHVLIHTGWDRYWEQDRFCVVDPDETSHFPGILECAANLLLERKVKMVGIDSMGLDIGKDSKFPAHITLLNNDICIVENLANLELLPPKGAKITMYPMKIKDAAEAPVRAVASIE